LKIPLNEIENANESKKSDESKQIQVYPTHTVHGSLVTNVSQVC
jgi:hypothetical protein